MKNCLMILSCVLYSVTISFIPKSFAENSFMVKKHIFGQYEKADVSKSDKSVKKSDLYKIFERKVHFTGILNLNGSQRALLKKKSGSKETLQKYFAVGETIIEMKLVEIGKNYIVLSKKGEKFKLNLFRDRQDRPVTLKTPKVSSIKPIKNALKNSLSAKLAKTTNKTNVQKITKNIPSTNSNKINSTIQNSSTSNPFLDAVNKSKKDKPQRTTSNEANPFLELIRKAREAQEQ